MNTNNPLKPSTQRPDNPDWRKVPKPCDGDGRYIELKQVTRQERDLMVAACGRCPVYYECLGDLLSQPLWTHYGIQAGIEGRT